ncbi:LapA family protein [candidate division WOR-3 bacterium]|nr:LapA family protein [candidate division WOR-3 bacterium]
MYLVNILISAIIIILGIVVGTQNGGTIIDVKLLGWTFENISLSLLMLECILVGMIVIMLIAIFYEIKQRAKIYKLQKHIQRLESELKEVRKLIADNVDNNIEDEKQESVEEEDSKE